MKQITKVTPLEIQKTLMFLKFIEIVDSMDLKSSESNYSEYFSPEEIKVFDEFLDVDLNFQYQLFFEEFNKVLSGRFHLLIAGYSDLIEKYCNPDSELLVPVENQITIKAEEVCEFTSFSMWVNKARDWIGSFSPNEKIICVDKNGNTLTGGFDFQYADSINLFPIKAYRLIRNTDEKIVKSLSNN